MGSFTYVQYLALLKVTKRLPQICGEPLPQDYHGNFHASKCAVPIQGTEGYRRNVALPDNTGLHLVKIGSMPIRRLGGAHSILPKRNLPNLPEAYIDTWLSLPESRV
jgi:hypothetical protein